MNSSKKLVLYHGNCVDGLTAASIARRQFGNKAEYVAVHYGEAPPDVTGRDVYVLDFCYPAEDIEQMAAVADGLTVLDHHKTAEAWMREARHRLQDNALVYIHFDMQKSGAGLTADLFQLRNWWVDYVEDRDLWRFKLPNSKTINAFIQSVPRTLDDYEAAMQSLDPDQAHVLGMGSLRYLEMYVREMVPQARLIDFAGHKNIPCVNAPFVGISELVGALAETALFAMGWSQSPSGVFVVSLRSRGAFDVSELAAQYGGGGHRAAAGFSLKTPPPWL